LVFYRAEAPRRRPELDVPGHVKKPWLSPNTQPLEHNDFVAKWFTGDTDGGALPPQACLRTERKGETVRTRCAESYSG